MLLYRKILFVVLLHYSLPYGSTGAETTLCPTVYTVDAKAARNCSQLLMDRNYTNITCSSLQDLLKIISNAPSNRATDEDSTCIEIRIRRGHHVITSNFTFIGHNLTLVGESEDGHHVTTISFNLSDVFDPRLTDSPQYVFSFIHSSLIEIRDLSFLESPGIITAINVKSVLIENCSFRYFFQGAVDLYNCHFVTVRDSIFEHNGPVVVVKKEPYRGHSGGLSFGYVRLKVEDGPRVSVSNCTFRNNTSDPMAVQRTSDVLQQFVFTGRGGGCIFIVSPYTPMIAKVENSTFEDNFARSFAGALYFGLNGSLDHSVTVNRVKFIRNVCAGGGGGLHYGFADGRGDSVNRHFILNSEFIENYATFGGGAYYMSADAGGTLSNSALFYNCTFTRNSAKEYGSAFGAVNIHDTVNIYFENCVFERNDGGRGGVLSTAFTTLTFRGNSSFIQNRGRGLVVIGAYIEIRGGISFIENNGAGIDGSAVYVTSLGQLKLFRGANITFTGNTGVIGAGIVIDALPVPPVYSRLVKNPLCTLLYEDSSQRPDDWENVSLGFSENTAIIASGVYLNNLDLCSWTGKQSPWFEPRNVFRWKFVEYSESNMNSAHDPDGYNQDWSVQTSAVDIKITSNETVAYPGEQIQLGIQALDEIGRSTSDIIRITDLSDNFSLEATYRFEPSTITINNITQGAVHTSYLSPTKDIDYISSRTMQVETLLGSTTFANAELQSRKCLPGYILSDSHDGSYKACQCDISNPHILECNGADILLNAGLWATTDSYSTYDAVVMYPCPTGYCRCVPIAESNSIHCLSVYRSTNPDSQCSCERKGDLCGECKDGKGVSALLNRCTHCSDVSGLLIPLLLVLDAIVFIVLLVIIKPLPAWVYPCIFYIQVVPYLTEHFPTTFDQIQPALYYISSGLSFYFIYDFCLYSNMSPAVSYFLRYLPLLLAIVIVGCWFALMTKFKRKPHNWNGLWWIFLLMYTHLVHTSMSILNCPVLPGRDGSHKSKWYVSGNIQCFSSDHAGLGLLAIIILTLCVVMIPLSLAYNMDWIKRPRLLKHVFEPLILPFKQRYRWWASVDLSRRVLLVLFAISIPQNEYSVTILLMILLTVYGFVQPYREKAINLLEVVFSVNVIILLLLRNTQTVEDTHGIPSTPPTDNNSTSQCTDNQSIKITEFTWILFPFYYSILLITCVVVTVWITIELRYKVKTRQHQQRTFSVLNSSLMRKQVSTSEIIMNVDGNSIGKNLAYNDCDDSFADIVIINNNK